MAAPGTWVYEYASTDVAGNVEETKTVTVRLDTTRPVAKALYNRAVIRGRYVRFYYRIDDRYSPKAKTVKIRIYRASRLIKTITLRDRTTDQKLSYRFRCTFRPGRYTYTVSGVDLAGNISRQTKASRRTLTVR